MAVSKVIETTGFSIEVENGTDKNGVKVYKKKAFSGIKTDATPENVFAVAEAIKAVLAAGTGAYHLNESSKLVNA